MLLRTLAHFFPAVHVDYIIRASDGKISLCERVSIRQQEESQMRRTPRLQIAVLASRGKLLLRIAGSATAATALLAGAVATGVGAVVTGLTELRRRLTFAVEAAVRVIESAAAA